MIKARRSASNWGTEKQLIWTQSSPQYHKCQDTHPATPPTHLQQRTHHIGSGPSQLPAVPVEVLKVCLCGREGGREGGEVGEEGREVEGWQVYRKSSKRMPCVAVAVPLLLAPCTVCF